MSKNEAPRIPFTEEHLRANILRTWDRAQIERFALHLLGDEAQAQFGRPTAAGSAACSHPEREVREGPRVPMRWGTSPTQVCTCGAWRLTLHGPRPWRTDSLEEALKPDPEL